MPILFSILNSDPGTEIGAFALQLLVYAVLGLVPACAVLYGGYVLLTLPMRRNERARLFLELLTVGLNEGQTPEHAILDAASSHDNSPGARFHLLAAHLKKGLRFNEALEKVPRLLPPQIIALLKTGERIGDIRKVLPACQRLLHDGISQVRGALNYLLILIFAVTPFTVAVPLLIGVYVLPRFREVFAGIGGGHPLPAFTQFVFGNSRGLILTELAILSLVWILLLAYVGGPRLRRWIDRAVPGLLDRMVFRLPWRRRRLLRDFSAMLAMLLDAGVPESEAVTLAADATTNAVLRKRASKVCTLLRHGVKLPVAIRQMEDSGELQWRLANALPRRHRFLNALEGWHEALDAKAFQLEQAAAQITTSAVVLFNGVVVACIVIAVFLAIISLLNRAVLW